MIEKPTKRPNRRALIFSGFVFGIFVNTIITLQFTFVLVNIVIMIILLTGCVASLLLARKSWNNEKKLSKSRRLRLFLFGLSGASFLLVAVDLMVFLVSPHGVNQQLFAYSGDYPYLWLGTLPLVSVLGSALIAGFFSLVERFLELHEKKDL